MKLRSVLPILLLLALVGAVYHPVLAIGLVGHDTYPIILASQIDDLGDLSGTFSEKLMDDQYFSDFWRPLLNLTVAADHALWGLEGRGYQITSLLCFAGAALALFALARRLCGPGTSLGPILAAGWFVLFPLQYEVIPIIARRPDTLGVLFGLLAIERQLHPKYLESARPAVVPAVFALLAFLSKETSLLVYPVLVLAAFLYSSRTGWAKRAAQALSATAGSALAAAAVVAVRFAVIGGLGGHEDANVGDFGKAFDMAERLILPVREMRDTAGSGWLVFALVLALGASAAFAWKSRSSEAASARARATVVALGWLVPMLAIHGYAGARAWYFVFPFAGFALLVGVWSEGLFAALRRGTAPLRLGAALSLAMLAIALACQTTHSPLLRQYPEWQRAETARAEFFDKLEKRVSKLETDTGKVGPIRLPVIAARAKGRGPNLAGVSILRAYSVQAWGRLQHPEWNLRAISLVTQRPGDPVVLPEKETPPGTIEAYLIETYLYPEEDEAGGE